MTDVTSEALLEVEELVKHFPIHGSELYVQACQDVTFTLNRGETLGVVGESGSGKTTLGRCLLRLLEPTSGKVVLDGVDLGELSGKGLRAMRSDMQIVFQEPFDSLNPQLSIGYQVTDPLRVTGSLKKAELDQRALELLDLVGLPRSVAGLLPRGLSPGTLQRCAIARAISTDPKLIVLDEPTSALPPEAEVDVIRLLNELQDRLGLSYIFISHDLSLVKSFCDRVAVMYLSQVVELGPAADVFANPQHPYSRALLASVLEADPRHRRARVERRQTLEGEIPSPIDLPKGCYLAGRCPYVKDRCRQEPQRLERIAERHQARCWRVAEGDLAPAETVSAQVSVTSQERDTP